MHEYVAKRFQLKSLEENIQYNVARLEELEGEQGKTICKVEIIRRALVKELRENLSEYKVKLSSLKQELNENVSFEL